ncbi:hypothetical protein INR49_019839 [Caranx melampygus]|nr:hypothetical protein INR49_019839 [Caranx melampygus]
MGFIKESNQKGGGIWPIVFTVCMGSNDASAMAPPSDVEFLRPLGRTGEQPAIDCVSPDSRCADKLVSGFWGIVDKVERVEGWSQRRGSVRYSPNMQM